jgi:hypothetical protein
LTIGSINILKNLTLLVISNNRIGKAIPEIMEIKLAKFVFRPDLIINKNIKPCIGQ